jgi:hypothetical protein
MGTLLQDLATIVRNICMTRGATAAALRFELLIVPTAAQKQALQLLRQITVKPASRPSIPY